MQVATEQGRPAKSRVLWARLHQHSQLLCQGQQQQQQQQ
jgi:hypothetical protein